ncbi:hypothetical protein SAMN05216281_103215 [Cryobacterium luteum]|nr:hypothetical protein SAMN05216281_103215 [Cryobacterium luteum]
MSGDDTIGLYRCRSGELSFPAGRGGLATTGTKRGLILDRGQLFRASFHTFMFGRGPLCRAAHPASVHNQRCPPRWRSRGTMSGRLPTPQPTSRTLPLD